jgi:ADP-heptose:LPS heptosyltransferase
MKRASKADTQSMPGVLDALPPSSRVLLVRLRSMGDCVLTTPAIRLLKQARPDLRIAVVVEDRFAAIFEDNPDIEMILAPTLRRAFAWKPALTVNLHGRSRSTVLTVASMAPRRAGFGHYRFQPVYNLRIPRAQEILGDDRTVHTAEHLASAMFWLGVPRTEIPRACLFTERSEAARDYAVLHPFSSMIAKAWPAQRFAELARWLRDEQGLEPLIMGAGYDDFSAFADFRCLRGAPLRDVKRLMAGAKLFVGNDSGPAHVAAAFGVPVVVLYGFSDPTVWAPWRTRSESIVAPSDLENVPLERVTDAVKALRS